MSFATLADLRAADRLFVNANTATQSGENGDEWTLVAATLPTVATTPGTVHTSSSTLFNFPDTGSDEKYMTEWAVQTSSNAAAGAYMLLDRLVSVSQLITSTGTKTINSSALTRYTTGAGVAIFLEVSTVTATNAVVVSVNSYTNQSGTAGRAGAAITFPSTALNVGTWMQMPLQAGDSGARSVESISVTTASGGSGTVNVVLAKPLAMTGVATSPSGTVSATLVDNVVPIRIYDGAHLDMLLTGYAGAERTATSITAALS